MTHATAALVLGVLCIAASGPALAGSVTQTSDVGANPISRTTEKTLDLAKGGRVDVRSISGSVAVEAGASGKVELVYTRRAATQKDFDCQTLEVEDRKDEVRIWVKSSRECRVIRAEDQLVLKVPRDAAVSLSSIGDWVKVRGVAGLVKVESVGDSATLDDVEQVDVQSIGDTVKVDVRRLGAEGIRVRSVGDSVELSLPRDVDARLRIDSVGDEIRGPDFRTDTHDERFETVLGKGGADIRISSIGDSVRIEGPRLRN